MSNLNFIINTGNPEKTKLSTKIILIKLTSKALSAILLLLIYIKIEKVKKSFSFKHLYPKISSPPLIEDEEELKNIKIYIQNIQNNILINEDTKKIISSDFPLISVIISVYNGEAYIRKALLSIQNQDFKDIEIIMIDDCSIDNSVNLIKELMIKEPRIVLLQNKENRGALFTKTKGVLSAKGKYILILDEDDLYIQRDAFSTLYQEAEKNNLDMLNFISLISGPRLDNLKYKKTKLEFPIIFQPQLSEIMFQHTSNGEIQLNGGMLHDYFIKKSLFIKIINLIDEKYFYTKMNWHDDFLLFFLLIRNAYNAKKIERIFYIYIVGWDKNDKNTTFRNNEKYKNYNDIRCNSLLNFIEFILENTNNTFRDKKIASFSINTWLLNYRCRNYNGTLKRAIKISKLYLQNKYIQDVDKKKIEIFLKEKNHIK